MTCSACTPDVRRLGVLWLALAGLVVVGAVMGASPPTFADDASRPPNVVLIIADDQSYNDMGFMGHPVVRTPHLDRLAEQSARYINAYNVTSLCRPSLATLMTGLYQHQHGIHFNHPPPGFGRMRRLERQAYRDARAEGASLIREVPLLPRVLAERGYRTFQAGKHWEGDYANAGFTHGMTRNEPSAEPAYGNLELADGSRVAHGNGDAGLNIGRTTMQPIYDFIEASDNRPFLLWYAPFLPHTPHDAPDRFVELYEDRPDVPDVYVPYYAACTWFDETVGELVDYLEREGHAENTVFIFISDNGWAPDPDQPDRMSDDSKRSPFEAGLRTPVLIRWDNRVEPATHQELVSSVDIVPTVLSALEMDGRMGELPGVDLMPSARGDRQLDDDRAVFGAVYPGDATSLKKPADDVAYRWVRQGEYKLLVPHLDGQGRAYRDYLREPALTNVLRDPNERTNLLGDSAYEESAEHLQTRLDEWWTPR